VINLVTRTKEKYRKGRRLKFCRTVHISPALGAVGGQSDPGGIAAHLQIADHVVYELFHAPEVLMANRATGVQQEDDVRSSVTS